MDYFEFIVRLIDKYGLPLGFAAYFMLLQWRFHSQIVSALGRIEGRLDTEQEEKKEDA